MSFNESEWIKLIFLLADTQTWLNEMSAGVFAQLPISNKKKIFRKNYFLTPEAITHILERHYYKINRHPGTGKFNIPLVEILHYIREAHTVPVSPIPGCSSLQRVIQAEEKIGFDKNGLPTALITILTDRGGKIITAFPGELSPSQKNLPQALPTPVQPEHPLSTTSSSTL